MPRDLFTEQPQGRDLFADKGAEPSAPNPEKKHFSWSDLGSAAKEDIEDLSNSSVMQTLKSPGNILSGKIKPGTEEAYGAARDVAGGIAAVPPAFSAARSVPSVVRNIAPATEKLLKSVGSDIPAIKQWSESELKKHAKEVGLPIDGKTPHEILNGMNDYFNKGLEKVTKTLSPNYSHFDPVHINNEISASFEKALEHNTNQWRGVKADFHDVKVNDENLLVDVDHLMSELKQQISVAPQERAAEAKALSSLDNIRKRMFSSPIMQLADKKDPFLGSVRKPEKVGSLVNINDLIDLKQSLNENFDPRRFSKSSDMPYVKISNKVDNLIGVAGKRYPEALSEYNKAKDGWADLSRKYRENKVLGQFWDEKDYWNWKVNKNRFLDGKKPLDVHPETEKRASSMLTKIKTPADLRAATEALERDSPGLAFSINAAKLRQIMDSSGINSSTLRNNKELIDKALGDNRGAREMLGNMSRAADILDKRGIALDTPEYILKEQTKDLNSLVGRVWRTFSHAKSGNPVEALRSAVGKSDIDRFNGQAKRLMELRKENDTPLKMTIRPPKDAQGQ